MSIASAKRGCCAKSGGGKTLVEESFEPAIVRIDRRLACLHGRPQIRRKLVRRRRDLDHRVHLQRLRGLAFAFENAHAHDQRDQVQRIEHQRAVDRGGLGLDITGGLAPHGEIDPGHRQVGLRFGGALQQAARERWIAAPQRAHAERGQGVEMRRRLVEQLGPECDGVVLAAFMRRAAGVPLQLLGDGAWPAFVMGGVSLGFRHCRISRRPTHASEPPMLPVARAATAANTPPRARPRRRPGRKASSPSRRRGRAGRGQGRSREGPGR